MNVAIHSWFQHLVVAGTGLVAEAEVVAMAVERAAIVGVEADHDG